MGVKKCLNFALMSNSKAPVSESVKNVALETLFRTSQNSLFLSQLPFCDTGNMSKFCFSQDSADVVRNVHNVALEMLQRCLVPSWTKLVFLKQIIEHLLQASQDPFQRHREGVCKGS